MTILLLTPAVAAKPERIQSPNDCEDRERLFDGPSGPTGGPEAPRNQRFPVGFSRLPVCHQLQLVDTQPPEMH
jgi:hypothetical protein